MEMLISSLRVTVVTMLICVVGYTAVVWAVGRIFTPLTAEGSLISAPDGTILGSRLIAQKFTQPDYFWPRPSAVDYNASAAGGSNKSPTSSELTRPAQKLATLYGASPDRPLPVDLAAASGGGLDPHITEHAALYQAARIAGARGMPTDRVETLIREHAFSPGGPFTRGRIVNVLELNLALDALQRQAPTE